MCPCAARLPQPLRILLPDVVGDLAPVLTPLVKASMGWDVDVTVASLQDVALRVMDTAATGRAFFDGRVPGADQYS